jgi:hypothetical protein
MAEAGFAAPASARTTTAQQTREQQQIARPAEAQPQQAQSDITLSRITDHLTEQVRQHFSGRLLEYFLPRDARASVVKAELRKFVCAEFMQGFEGLSGSFKQHVESKISDLLSLQAVYNALHERHSRSIRDNVSESLTDQLDPIIDGLIVESVERINDVNGSNEDRINNCMANQALYLTFVDMVVRRILAKLATWSPPTSIVFETKDVDEPCFDGIKMIIIWDGGRSSRNSATMQNGQYMVVQQFPWLGRNAMIMPQDADHSMKDLVRGRRRLYVKSLIALISPLVVNNAR